MTKVVARVFGVIAFVAFVVVLLGAAIHFFPFPEACLGCGE